MPANDQKNIHIVGAGGVGWWFTVGLASTEANIINVYDDDGVEGSGATRLPLAVGNKAQSLNSFLRFVMGKGIVQPHQERFTGKEVNADDWVFDCSDAGDKDRRDMWTRLKKRGANVMRVSYDGDEDIIEISSELPFWLGETTEGYRQVPSLPLSLAAGGLGAVVAGRILNSRNKLPKLLQFNLQKLLEVEEVE